MKGHMHCDERHGHDTSCLSITVQSPTDGARLKVWLFPGGEVFVSEDGPVSRRPKRA